MAYIAIKPCRFAGQSFRIGDEVPADVIQPGAAKNLVKMGIIAAPKDGGKPAPTIEYIPDPTPIRVGIPVEDGRLNLNLTAEGLQAIFDVLTATISEAEPVIREITDNDALILLHESDPRKSIKELVETRAKALNAIPEDSESEGE